MNRIYRLPAIVCVVFLTVLLSAGIGYAQPVMDRMTQQGVLTIGVRADAFPFTYLDIQGQPTGFSIDLVNLLKGRLEEKLGRSIKLDFATVNTSDRYDFVKQGKIDLLCDSSSFSRSRAMDALFSTGYFQTGTQLLVRKDDNLGSRFRIGVIPGTTNADSVKRRLAFAEFVNLPNREAGLMALENDRIDALASDGILLEALRQTSPHPDQLTVIPRNPYDEQTYACLIPPGNDRFQTAVNTVLAEFMQGVLDNNPEDLTLLDRWFGETGIVPIDREPILAFFRHTLSGDSGQAN